MRSDHLFTDRKVLEKGKERCLQGQGWQLLQNTTYSDDQIMLF